jgi:hypothetical protein
MNHLRTFKEHMQLENELHDWMVVCHYEDKRIFFFAHFKKSLYQRVAELIPYIKRANPLDQGFFGESYIQPEEIKKCRRKFSKIIGKRISEKKEFIGVVNFNYETVWWTTDPQEFYEAYKDNED